MNEVDKKFFEDNQLEMKSLKLYMPKNMEVHVEKVKNGLYHIPGIYRGEGLRIIDIGANLGSFSKWAYNAYPNSTITAYEPNPDMAILFRTNCPEITLYEVAVTTNELKEMKLYRGKTNCGENSLFSDYDVTEEFDMVKTVHPDTLPECDFLKVDAEGVEVEILENYVPRIMPGAIALEVHGIKNMVSLPNLLKDHYYLIKEDRWHITRSDQTWIRKDLKI